jgi:hypothetical protein
MGVEQGDPSVGQSKSGDADSSAGWHCASPPVHLARHAVSQIGSRFDGLHRQIGELPPLIRAGGSADKNLVMRPQH